MTKVGPAGKVSAPVRDKSGKDEVVSGPEIVVTDARSRISTGVRYSICTLVTKPEQYAGMAASFAARGFRAPDCEFLTIDNSQKNELDAYQGVNLFLTVARGDYVIICHQDVLLLQDGREVLDRVLARLTALDPNWAVCGNSGGISPGRMAIRITDPFGADQQTTVFPARVYGLDENFLVVRRSANLSVSHDLSGFHVYGTDLCVMADVLGLTSYVVDFHLEHLSRGFRDDSLVSARRALLTKYQRAFRSRWLMTPCGLFFLSNSRFWSRFLSSTPMARLRLRLVRGRNFV